MRTRTILMGAAAGVGLALAARYAAQSCEPEPGRPTGRPGPLPRRPGTGAACRRPEPDPMGAADLWVDAACSTWNVGPAWDGRRLLPALQAWADAGWTDRARFDHHTVARETLRSYVACIDAWPWADLWSDQDRPTPNEWAQRWREADSRYPEIARLIQSVVSAYGNILAGAMQGEAVFRVDHPDGRSFEFFGSELGPTLAMPAFAGIDGAALESLTLGGALRSQGFSITRIA